MSLVYVIITSLPDIYGEQYEFPQRTIGLTYWGLGMYQMLSACKAHLLTKTGIGMIYSTLTVGHFLDWYLLYNIRLGKSRSESRLPPMILGSILVPLGILSFGWTVQYHVHWIVPIICSSLVGFGYVSMAISAWTYLVDAFGIYAASATAGTVLLRNAGAAGLPLAGPSLVRRLDWGWGFTVLALVSFLMVPISVSLMYTGERIRTSKFHRRLALV
jgi:MFS family permease